MSEYSHPADLPNGRAMGPGQSPIASEESDAGRVLLVERSEANINAGPKNTGPG
jgi:hypothetical protein